MKKGTKLYSVLHQTCPKCQEGPVFMCRNNYNLKEFAKMHSKCPKCGLNYQPEPGFFYGAGYVSYALGAAIVISITVGMSFFLSFFENFEIYGAVIVLTMVALTPVLFRLSRVIWLNMFYKYDKDAIKHFEETHQGYSLK